MKKTLILLAAVCSMALSAIEITDKAPAIQTLADGEIVAAPHKASIKKQLAKKDGALIFNGSGFVQVVRAFPSDDLSIVADVTVDKLPEKSFSVIAGRTGFHSMLGITTDGRYTLSLWGVDKKTNRRIVSKSKIVLGKPARIAAVFTDQGNATTMQLFVNGQLEASADFPAKSYPYDKNLFIGALGLSKDGSALFPFFGKISAFWYCMRPLTIQEITALK